MLQRLKLMWKERNLEREIEDKIQEIVLNINTFKDTETKFMEKSIRLVNELIDLKRIKNKDYGFVNVLQEKELINYSDVLEKYVPYEVLSDYSTELYHEGKLNNKDAMAIAHLPRQLLHADKQNKIAKLLVEEKVTSKQILNSTTPELYKLIGDKTKVKQENEKLVLNSIQRLNIVKNFILENKDLIKTSRYKDRLEDSFDKLKEAMGDLK